MWETLLLIGLLAAFMGATGIVVPGDIYDRDDMTGETWTFKDHVKIPGDLKFLGLTGVHDIVLSDNVADALAVSGGAADLLNFVTTNNAEEVVINESGNADIDFRAEGDTVTNLLATDAGLDGAILGGSLALPGDISPAALAGTVDNYNPTGLAAASVLRIDPGGAARIMNGLAGGRDGRVVLLMNIATAAGQTLSLAHEAAASTAANRFLTNDGTDANAGVIDPNGTAILVYDATSSRWRVLAHK